MNGNYFYLSKNDNKWNYMKSNWINDLKSCMSHNQLDYKKGNFNDKNNNQKNITIGL